MTCSETTLKTKQCVAATRTVTPELPAVPAAFALEFSDPTPSLFEFKGKATPPGADPVALGIDQLLLRGSVVRNTAWAVCVAVFIGSETKQLQSGSGVVLKRSHLERRVNVLVVGMFVLELSLAFVSDLMNFTWRTVHDEHFWYLRSDKSVPDFIRNFFTFVILFNNLVPISLYVSLEVVRIGQAWFINNDGDMVHNGKYAEARTSNLNEELGLLDYVFADKTGTLTQNRMVFKAVCRGGD